MNKRKQRIITYSVLIFLIAGGIALAVKYLPLNIILKKSSSPEAELIHSGNVENPAPNSLFYDFEIDPKTLKGKELYKGIAHSGQYSSKTFGKNTFSVIIEKKASEVGLENLNGVAMSAWIYIFPGDNDVQGSLVFTASNNGINLTWQGVGLQGKDLPREKWFKISGFFKCGDIVFNPDTKLQFYFWNNSSNDFLVDDIYIVFGTSGDRPGDSALVDMTRGKPFTPRFNFPPYPFSYFSKEEIGNGNSNFLVKNTSLQEGEIKPGDVVLSGHFLSQPSGTEDILVIRNDESADLFVFNKEAPGYKRSPVRFPGGLTANLKNTTILKGNFSGKGFDQLIIAGDKGVSLCTLNKSAVKKSDDESAIPLNWTSVLLDLPGISVNHETTIYATDLNGDKITELLIIKHDGSWKIYNIAVNTGKPVTFESNEKTNLGEWKLPNSERKIFTGKFLQQYPFDILLTIIREKGKNSYSYILHRFDKTSLRFVSCFPEKQGHHGKTIGLDTLKPSDQFITGVFDNSGKTRIFRYNRDWRYDLKEIRFNDTTFQVIANIDFTGYEKDHNPKYFHTLSIFTGNFLAPNQASLLLIQKNHDKKDYKMLPDAIQIYSLEKPIIKR